MPSPYLLLLCIAMNALRRTRGRDATWCYTAVSQMQISEGAEIKAANLPRANSKMDANNKNLEEMMADNPYYRNVVETAEHSQLVLMRLRPCDTIPRERHRNTDQFFRVEAGAIQITRWHGGLAKPSKTLLVAGTSGARDWDIVRAGTEHQVHNPSDTETALLYTVYCGEPPHAPGLLQPDADGAHHLI